MRRPNSGARSSALPIRMRLPNSRSNSGQSLRDVGLALARLDVVVAADEVRIAEIDRAEARIVRAAAVAAEVQRSQREGDGPQGHEVRAPVGEHVGVADGPDGLPDLDAVAPSENRAGRAEDGRVVDEGPGDATPGRAGRSRCRGCSLLPEELAASEVVHLGAPLGAEPEATQGRLQLEALGAGDG